MKKIKIIEVGFGPHAKRTYGPALQKYSKQFNVELSLVVDLKEKEADIRSYFSQMELTPNFLFIKPFKKCLPREIDKYLTDYVKRKGIQGVIISTEPLTHYVYAKWALRAGLNILMDKPITSRKSVVSSSQEASGIYRDYIDLLNLYRKLQKRKNTVFSINVQRRYHIGHQKVMTLIKEVAEKFDAPVTSIQSMHSDGQWRFPSEIVTQIYHPYCQGYGKCSHSGYHIFDIAYQYYKAGKRDGKYADSGEVLTSFIQPRGFIKQFSEKNYIQYFGKKYKKVQKWNDKKLYKLYKDYGEMDAFSIIKLLKNSENVCNISINLLHNSFARRTWLLLGKDLYKGNGRVKQQLHIVNQGPFQTVHIHNYQSKDKQDKSTEDDYEVGGNNHFDIYVFRNARMFSFKIKPFVKYSYIMSRLKNKL